MQVGNLLLTVTTLDEVIDHAAAQGARAIQGHERNHVFKMLRRQFLDQVGNPRRFHLKDAGRIAFGQKLTRFRIVERNSIDVEIDAVVLIDHLDRITDDSQGSKAEKVHLEQSQVFDKILFILRRKIAFLGVLDRYVIVDGRRRNDDAGSMGRRVAHQAFERFSEVDQTVDRIVRLVFTAELFAHLQGLVEGHAQFIGHQFYDAVHFT